MLLMLTLPLYTNTLPIEKTEEFEDFDVVQMNFDRKRTEEGKINKTCVSSQNRRNKKRRGRHCSGVTYLLLGETVLAGLVRAGRAAILHGDI